MAYLTRLRKLASRTLSVGKNKIKFQSNSQNSLTEISKIRSRAGVRMLHSWGQIQIKRFCFNYSCFFTK